MLSLRQLKRSGTRGGRGEYEVDPVEFGTLVTLFANTRGKDETKMLLRSVLTNREMADIVRRIKIARWLQRGMTYDQIAELTDAGRTTIALVGNALKSNGGIFERILHRTPQILSPIERSILSRLKRGK